jgi:hypothetical protein
MGRKLPKHGAVRTDQNAGRDGDILPQWPASLMQQPVRSDHLSIRNRQDGKRKIRPLDELLRSYRRIGRNSRHLHAELSKLLMNSSETSGLSHAESAPGSAVEYQKDGPGIERLAE